MKTPPFDRWFVATVLVVGLAVRVVGLTDGLWHDEIHTLLQYASRPLGDVLTSFDSQNQHLLYSALARISFVVTGGADWSVRIPAVGFGVASLWAVYWFARQIGFRTEGLMAAAFLAVSYHHVWFSQNARGYSALIFWALVTTGLFHRLLDRPVRSDVWWYAGTMAAACYTNVTAAFLAMGHLVVWAVLTLRQRKNPNWYPAVAVVAAGLLSVLLYLPVMDELFGTLLVSAQPGVETEWKNPLWFAAEMIEGLARGLPGGLVTVVGGMIVALVGAWVHGRAPAVLGLMVLPSVLLAVVMVITSHNLWPRLFIPAIGFGVIIGAAGVRALAERLGGPFADRIWIAVWSLGVVGSSLTLPGAWRPKQDYRGAFAYVEEVRGAAPVGVVDMAAYGFRDYLGADWEEIESLDQLRRFETGADVTRLVYAFPTRVEAVLPELWAEVQSRYRLERRFPGSINGGDIMVMVR